MTSWSAADVPEQSGRTLLVTGANRGVGLEVARVLAARGAHVLLACRDEAAGHAAVAQLRAEAAGAALDVVPLDLADLTSVGAAAARVGELVDGVDVVVCNAGVMAVPQRRTTAQGFELHLGVNHLGHMALVAGLLPLLRARPGARVVSVTSVVHHHGQLALDDLQLERRYRPWAAYAQSKLANVLFGLELDRRSRAAGWGVAGLVAHPGVSRTHLGRGGPLTGRPNLLGLVVAGGSTVVGQGAARGALPELRAACDPDVAPGSCWGPRGPFELAGAPVQVQPSTWGADEQLAGWLWRRSEELLGASFPDVVSPG